MVTKATTVRKIFIMTNGRIWIFEQGIDRVEVFGADEGEKRRSLRWRTRPGKLRELYVLYSHSSASSKSSLVEG
jgi:hypothetical protein